MSELSPIQKLDKVLSYLNSQSEQWHNVPDVMQNISFITTISEMFFILIKLEKDGYAISEERTEIIDRAGNIGKTYTEKFYIINFEGKYLNKTGGYKYKIKRQTTSTNLQSIQTWSIAVGTALAGIYSLYELWKHVFSIYK